MYSFDLDISSTSRPKIPCRCSNSVYSSTMISRPLIARPSEPTVTVALEPQHVPTSDEWAEQFSEIKRLYVHERRKLKFVMKHMEKENGFKAT